MATVAICAAHGSATWLNHVTGKRECHPCYKQRHEHVCPACGVAMFDGLFGPRCLFCKHSWLKGWVRSDEQTPFEAVREGFGETVEGIKSGFRILIIAIVFAVVLAVAGAVYLLYLIPQYAIGDILGWPDWYWWFFWGPAILAVIWAFGVWITSATGAGSTLSTKTGKK